MIRALRLRLAGCKVRIGLRLAGFPGALPCRKSRYFGPTAAVALLDGGFSDEFVDLVTIAA
jgi:hypothetical protein